MKHLAILIALGAGLVGIADARGLDHTSETSNLYAACLERGGTDQQCHCVAVEAGSRFSEQEQAFIAQTARGDMDGEGQREWASVMTTQELADLTRRLLTAESVIQNTCGAGLLRMRGR